MYQIYKECYLIRDLDGDDKCDNQSHVEGACVDLSPGVGQSTDLISLAGCNPTSLMKDEEELQSHMKSIDRSFPTHDHLIAATVAVFHWSWWYQEKLPDPYCSWSFHWENC